MIEGKVDFGRAGTVGHDADSQSKRKEAAPSLWVLLTRDSTLGSEATRCTAFNGLRTRQMVFEPGGVRSFVSQLS